MYIKKLIYENVGPIEQVAITPSFTPEGNPKPIILVGEKQAVPILQGIKEELYDENNVYVAKDLNDAIRKMNSMMNNNTVVLFENDLPDNYL